MWNCVEIVTTKIVETNSHGEMSLRMYPNIFKFLDKGAGADGS